MTGPVADDVAIDGGRDAVMAVDGDGLFPSARFGSPGSDNPQGDPHGSPAETAS